MKRLFSIGSLVMALLLAIACENTESNGTHTHDDGTTHADHDTSVPAQQEFTVGDSTKTADSSSHKRPHSHGGQSHTH
jgi:hypothetical protein